MALPLIGRPQPAAASTTTAAQTTAASEAEADLQAALTSSFDPAGEIQRLKDLAHNTPMPAGLLDKVDRMLLRLARMGQMGGYSKEYENIEQYVRWITRIPWGKYSEDNLDLNNALQQLNAHHYGLAHVKDMVMEYLAVMKLQKEGMPAAQQMNVTAGQMQQRQALPSQPVNPAAPVTAAGAAPAAAVAPGSPPAQPAVGPAPTMPSAPPQRASTPSMSKLQGSSANAPVLCFIGIQGVGKTSIAKSIAVALGRPFIRVALGAMGNVSQIRGTTLGEPNSEPGQIIKALITGGSMNPVILLDEIDKTSSESGLRADLMAALLEILDPEQNATFSDHYVDYPVDLSRCLFITTANNLGGISAALQDRLEIVRFGSYTDTEKIEIAKSYMLPKVRQATGISEQQLIFDDEVWPLVIRPLGFDAGVRQLERTLTILARKVARLIVEGKGTQFHLTKDNFREFIPEDIGVYS